MAKVIDHGAIPPKPPTRPLQFKRGSAKAFHTKNPVLLYGEPAFELDEFKVKVGDGRTDYNRLPYIGDHSKPEDGKSAYELWLEEGHTGTIEDFFLYLTGDPGKSAYELWMSVGHEGSILDFLVDIQGDSAYDLWIKDGHTGTVTDFLDSLVGKSAYEIWLELGHTGTEQDFIDSLNGKSAYDLWLEQGYSGTIEEFFDWMRTTTWAEIPT